jgi:hypothetical protein
VKRIATHDDLIGFYLMRVVRGTVVEDPARRWTASRLLEEVRVTKELVGKVKEYESRGEIILADRFGAGDAFNNKSSISATTKDPPGDHDIGTAFKVPAGHDVRLESISLALDQRAGRYELKVRIAPDSDGKPVLGMRSRPSGSSEAGYISRV